MSPQQKRGKKRIWVLNSQPATAGWCIIAAVAQPHIWGSYKRHKVTQFYSEIKSVRTGKKQKNISNYCSMKLWYPSAGWVPPRTSSALPCTVMLQPVSSLIKSNSNTNKCQHLKAAHSSISYLHDMCSLNLIETQRARRPRTNLLGWRFNPKYLISYLSIGDVFLQSFFFLVLHFTISDLIRDEGIVKFKIWLAQLLWFNHRCHRAAQGTALTSRVSDPRR